MKKTDIEKKLLEASSKADIPSDFEETYRLVKQLPPSLSPSQQKKAPAWKWLAPLTAGTAAVVALAIVVPIALQGTTGELGGSSGTIGSLPVDITVAEANAISRQAVALFSLVPSFEEPSSPLALRAARRDSNDETRLSEAEKEAVAFEIDDFIYMVEEIQASGSWNVILSSNGSLLTVEGGEQTFLIQYEETIIDDATQAFTGTVSYASQDSFYEFRGTIVSEEGETELEMELDLREGGFIKVEQEIEQGENEYEFSFYEEGAKEPYRTLSYESEIEGRERESSLEISEAGRTVECEFEYEPTGVGAEPSDEFRCEYSSEEGEKKVEAEVYIDKIDSLTHAYRFDGDKTSITITRSPK